MSKYIEHIKNEYYDDKFSLDELNKLKEAYNKLSDSEKEKLEIKHLKKEVDSKNNKPQPKVNYQEQVVNLLKQQTSDISTIKGILVFYLVLFIISVFAYIVILNNI